MLHGILIFLVNNSSTNKSYMWPKAFPRLDCISQIFKITSYVSTPLIKFINS